jgi:hypothetical protein
VSGEMLVAKNVVPEDTWPRWMDYTDRVRLLLPTGPAVFQMYGHDLRVPEAVKFTHRSGASWLSAWRLVLTARRWLLRHGLVLVT